MMSPHSVCFECGQHLRQVFLHLHIYAVESLKRVLVYLRGLVTGPAIGLATGAERFYVVRLIHLCSQQAFEVARGCI